MKLLKAIWNWVKNPFKKKAPQSTPEQKVEQK